MRKTRMRRTHFAAHGARLLLALAAILACATADAQRPTHADDRALDEARAILSRHPLIDSHNDLPWVIRENGKPPRDVVAYDLDARTAGDTDIALRVIERYPRDLALALTADDIERANAE